MLVAKACFGARPRTFGLLKLHAVQIRFQISGFASKAVKDTLTTTMIIIIIDNNNNKNNYNSNNNYYYYCCC